MQERINWVIIPVNVTSANELVIIDRKLPTHLEKCIGVFLSVKTYLETNETVINHVGHLKSLSFNGKKDVPFSFHVGYNSVKPLIKARKFEFSLEDDINKNCQLYGIYEDCGAVIGKTGFIPYTVNLYLKCVKGPSSLPANVIDDTKKDCCPCPYLQSIKNESK